MRSNWPERYYPSRWGTSLPAFARLCVGLTPQRSVRSSRRPPSANADSQPKRRRPSADTPGSPPPAGVQIHLKQYALLCTGSLIIALAFNLFLNPNHVASGGVSGISTIVQAVWGLQPAYTQWALNLPLFLLGVWQLGGRFGLKTALGSAILPLFVLLTHTLPALTHNVLLATVFGAVGVGTGLGLVFRGQASTGGLDVAAQVIHKYTGLSLGICIAMLDGLVVLTAGAVFSPEKALYALIGVFVTSKTIDAVQVGGNRSKVAYIITRRPDEVSRAVLVDLDRGLTRIHASGGFTGEARVILMVVVGLREVAKLKLLVKLLDPTAFVILSDAAEVLGEGFGSHH